MAPAILRAAVVAVRSWGSAGSPVGIHRASVGPEVRALPDSQNREQRPLVEIAGCHFRQPASRAGRGFRSKVPSRRRDSNPRPPLYEPALGVETEGSEGSSEGINA